MTCSFNDCKQKQADSILGPISGTCALMRKPIPPGIMAQARRDADRIENPPKPPEKPPPGPVKPPDPPKPPTSVAPPLVTVTRTSQPKGPSSTAKTTAKGGDEQSTAEETEAPMPTETDEALPVVTVTVTGEDGRPITTLTITGDGSTAIEVRPTTVTGDHPAATGGPGGDEDDGQGPWRANPTDSSPFATIAAAAAGAPPTAPSGEALGRYLWTLSGVVVLGAALL
jgi:hypothetical protein